MKCKYKTVTSCLTIDVKTHLYIRQKLLKNYAYFFNPTGKKRLIFQNIVAELER